jgi:hypothetical protein
VLDTNVRIGPARRHLLLLASLGAYELITSRYILDEAARVMVRLGWNEAAAAALLQAIHFAAELVDEQTITGGSYDVWLQLRFAGTTILTAEAFIRLLEQT